MAFDTNLAAVVISPLADETMELLDSVPTEPETGWDTLVETWLIRNHAIPDTTAAANLFVKGTKLDGRTMWITNVTAKCRAPGIYIATVTSKGLLAAKSVKIRYGSAADLQTAENIVDPNSTLRPKVSVRESKVTCEVSYPLIGIVPHTHLVSTALSPSTHPGVTAPAVKSTVWSYLTNPTWHYPSGWVLDNTDSENIPGATNVWWITDRYVYEHEFSP